MKTLTYKPQGVCSRGITVTVDEENIITDIHIEGGCEGNHNGIIALCLGQEASAVAAKLEGITCGKRKTSCPDQLAKALKAVS
jgi:uncharacterized protein (TIGR03905 family)